MPVCHSTNDIAAEIIQSGNNVFEGMVIITDNQTAGRGQRGNVWEASVGENLTFSLILKPNFLKASEQFKLNVAVSLGVLDCLSEYIDDDLKVKWSNDIYFQNQKMGGILIENTLQGYQIGFSVIGIGLNINQTQFPIPNATSLRNVTTNPLKYDLSDLLSELLACVEKNYLAVKNGDYEVLKERYLSNLFRINEFHHFRKNGQLFLGKIVGIDESGQLGIESDGLVEYYGFQEVAFVI
ncbi:MULTISPECIES: biotin--[acetyl-CoA-carboxylase] ligase [unclassified Arcicella]|uniref:biotin--[acetyl-CoA-carboxylase] ligase n=1 Tax=unclassified Arcicella TaxID=2644986 RepID=UPI002861EBE4|nr:MULTISPECIES: biotin--[acetyl-CoA-carboxylase] ligase [unclassified Arcicella]MDR6564313.1 BirA family biotin operon repressor/biotin-[acetyl-CoA-carboxylase] ligase [Arcicella sp. BE51]MDR6814064.1 BirA family biotin operon repressor/biotin-[acetyl-CoA-carboxylase] ligase [Arcicella sp. BE140]MDR6825376.1 BirA family biotin operon repressor/biotin-[acetyl-CoA-carboxylase] ligase [Arcicella sp. BE139]